MYHPCTYYYSTGIRPRRGRSTAIASVVPLGQRWLFSGERHIVGDASLCSNMRSDELFNRLLGQDARIIWFIWTPQNRVPSSSSVFDNTGQENQNSNDSVPVSCNQEIPIQSGTDFPPCSSFSVRIAPANRATDKWFNYGWNYTVTMPSSSKVVFGLIAAGQTSLLDVLGWIFVCAKCFR